MEQHTRKGKIWKKIQSNYWKRSILDVRWRSTVFTSFGNSNYAISKYPRADQEVVALARKLIKTEENFLSEAEEFL